MRRGSRYQNRIFQASVAVALCVGPSLVFAQQSQQQTPAQPTSPVTGNIGLSTNLSFDTNPNLAATSPGSRLRAGESASIQITTENNNNVLQFSTGGQVSFDLGGSGGLTFSTPTYRLNYTRTAANARLNIGGSYRQNDVSTTYDIDPTLGVFLVPDTGTVEVVGFNAKLDTGLQAPLGLSFGTSYSGVDYQGTSNPILLDTITVNYNAAANLRLSPVTQAQVTASLSTYDDNEQPSANSTETRSFGVSVTHELRRALTLSANFGVQEKDFLAGSFVGTRSGANASLTATQLTPRGDVFATLSVDETGPTARKDLTFGHNRNLPAGSLSASVTATDMQGYGTSILGNAAYNQQLADGSVGISLAQGISTNQLDQDILTTQLGLTYDQQVTQSSNFNVTLDVVRVEDAGAGAAGTQNRATLTASYDRQLTPEWDMSVGYRFRAYSDDTPVSANSNAIFLNLTRNIDFGF